jgi:hypothetical protein
MEIDAACNHHMILCSHTYHDIIQREKFKNAKNKWSTNTQGNLCTMKYYRFSRRKKLPIWSYRLLQIKEKIRLYDKHWQVKNARVRLL